jgi:hypothetical protein
VGIAASLGDLSQCSGTSTTKYFHKISPPMPTVRQ